MMCDASVLFIALQLARGLVADPNPCVSECRGVTTRNAIVYPEILQVQALRAEIERLEQRAADYKEFQRLAEMCSREPRILTPVVDANDGPTTILCFGKVLDNGSCDNGNGLYPRGKLSQRDLKQLEPKGNNNGPMKMFKQ